MTAREIADQTVEATVSEPERLAGGFLSYERFQVALHRTGEDASHQTRDLVRVGRVAAVLPVDLSRDEIVLLRQFRLAAHLATGRGELVEIVAGRIEKGETAADAARRECREEIGIAPSRLIELYSVLSTPGITDEYVTFFLGAVDATQIATRGPDRHEDTRPFAVSIDDALGALTTGGVQNALAVSALQWLALNRFKLIEWLER